VYTGFISMWQGLNTVAGAGDPRSRSGIAVHVYCCNTSMSDKYVIDSCSYTEPYKNRLLVSVSRKRRNQTLAVTS